MAKVVSFIRSKFPYFLGFCIVEALIYYFNGPRGNFTTGFPALFAVYLYYAWMSLSTSYPEQHQK
jgi:hypothetical protein